MLGLGMLGSRGLVGVLCKNLEMDDLDYCDIFNPDKGQDDKLIQSGIYFGR